MIMQAKSERMELRVSPDVRTEIETAAQLSHKSVSQFIAESALERAEAIIDEHSRIKIMEESWNAVRQALDNPIAPNEKLRRAVKRMNEDNTWKWKS